MLFAHTTETNAVLRTRRRSRGAHAGGSGHEVAPAFRRGSVMAGGRLTRAGLRLAAAAGQRPPGLLAGGTHDLSDGVAIAVAGP